MNAGAYAAAAKFGRCPICQGHVTADRKMSWLRRLIYTNLNLFPHVVWVAGYIGHRSCVEVLARGLWNGTLVFNDAGQPVIRTLRRGTTVGQAQRWNREWGGDKVTPQREHTRRRGRIRTGVHGVAARYLNHSVTRRSQAERESNPRHQV